MTNVSGATVRRLMRRHRVTVRELAQRFDLTQARVLYVRKHGGPWDWPLMIAKTAEGREKI